MTVLYFSETWQYFAHKYHSGITSAQAGDFLYFVPESFLCISNGRLFAGQYAPQTEALVILDYSVT